MAGYCLKNGRIQEAWGEDAAGRELAAVFHLTADGEMKELEALLLRHVDRVRQVSEELFVMAEIKSFGA